MRGVKLTLALVCMLIANGLLWGLPNLPQPLAPVPGGKLASVSFAPFRDGQSPLTKIYPTPAQIEEDLRVLSTHVAGVRTYTSLEGQEVVPELAQKYGLKVTQGAWLGPRFDNNGREIASLIDLANRYPETITRVIVGNEVLLRKDLTPDQLKAYIRQVKANVSQPVTYADVWEFWLKYPEIAEEVDFITIHLLPYWEDIPAGVEGAAERILMAYHEITERFPGKPILVGEAGWPTAGRTRGPAAPGLVEKARFINVFVNLAADNGFDYNLIEAFDQNWKSRLEGTVGGHWGLFTTDRIAKFALSGNVVENPHWITWAVTSTMLALGLLARFTRDVRPLRPARFFALAIAIQGLASAYSYALWIAIGWNYYWYDVLQAVTLLTLEGVALMTLGHALTRHLAGATGGVSEGFVPAGTAWHRRWIHGRLAGQVVLVFAVIALVWTLLLLVDGRYRDFPNPDFVVPVLGILTLGLYRWITRPRDGLCAAFAFGLALQGLEWREVCGLGRSWRHVVTLAPLDALLAIGLLLSAVAVVIAEGRLNQEAWQWAGLQIGLAIPFLATLGQARRGSAPRF